MERIRSDSPVRKLACAAMGFSVAIFAAQYLVPVQWLVPFAVGCFICLLPVLLLRGNARVRAGIFCLFAGMGFLRYAGYEVWTKQPPEQYVGQTLEVTARVVDFPVENGEYGSVEVWLETLETHAILYDYEGNLSSLSPGDRFTGEVKFASAGQRRGEPTDVYTSRGIFLRGYFQETHRLETGWKWRSLYAPRYVAKWLKDTIVTICPGETGQFLSALTTGDKSGIYQNTRRYVALSDAGIMHVVAVSGMHVSYLTAMCCLLLGAGRGRRAGIVLVLFFALMTGMSPSVVRASLMQILLLMAPGVRRENDALTSLSAALMLLLLANPGAAGAVSLQLSFASVAGLLFLTPRCYRWMEEKVRRFPRPLHLLGRFAAGSVSATLGATLFSAPLTAGYFGFIPLYSVLTNLLVLWLIPVCFAGGFLIGIVGAFLPSLGCLLGRIMEFPVKVIYGICEKIADLPGAVISLSGNALGWWLAGCYAVFLLTYLVKRKGQSYRPVLPVCLCICSLCIFQLGSRWYFRSVPRAVAVDVGQGAGIVLLSGETTMVVDCGGDDYGSAGDRMASYLLGRQRDRIDLLVLTHAHEDHTNGVARLMERIPVEHLVLAEACEDEGGALPEILESAQRHGTQIHKIVQDTALQIGEFSMTAYVPPYQGENQGLFLLVSRGTFDILITGDADVAGEEWLIRHGQLPDGELLVAGHHGSGTSTSPVLLDVFSPEQVMISVGYNSYGHPDTAVLDRLAERNVIVYRTDKIGDVEIRMEQNGEEGNP